MAPPSPLSPAVTPTPSGTAPAAPPANSNTFAQLSGRIIVAVGLSMLTFAIWDEHLAQAAQWTTREWRVLPSVSIFVLTSIMAIVIQAAIPTRRFILTVGLLAAAGSIAMLGIRGNTSTRNEMANPGSRHAKKDIAASETTQTAESLEPTGSVATESSTIVNFAEFELALFSALLLGTWLGRHLRMPAHFLTFVLCAMAGNGWIAAQGLAKTEFPGHLLSLLRIPWPVGAVHFCPTVLELLVLCAVLEAARGMGLHLFSMFLGSAAGYCGGAFLALEPWPSWPTVGVVMCTMGMLIASWPDLKVTRRDALKAMLAGLSLLALLLSLTVLRRYLVPETESAPDPLRYRGST
jgi:hypothetical protein